MSKKKDYSHLRGIRNNNPGNIDYNPRNKWQGQIGIEPPPPGGGRQRFAQFKDPVYGIRAIARLLITYYDDHGLDTPYDIIARWAPPVENDTKAYAQAVAKDIGIGINARVNLHKYEYIRPFVTNIIEHENGLKSYKEVYTDAQIDKALTLAGVEPPEKPIAKTRTVKGATTATTGIVLASATEVVTEVSQKVEPLVPYAEVLKLVFVVLALVGIGLTVYARIDDRRKGLR